MGPGELILSPQESHRVPCQLDLSQPAPKGIIVVETSDSVPLPHGVMFQPVVAPTSAIDPNCFSLLIQNETKKEITITSRSRRLAPADIEDVRKHLQELLDAGVIKESRSPYASPIVVAQKKNGNVHMCIDYRTLNSKTIPDQYTTPRIDDALDCLAGSLWFSVLDLRSGYYQIAMTEEDKDKTVFICPLGFYQFERMPQGVMGAPATF
ncbi:hypothetical protein SRHO_G00124330 [Serrasalmus rhombeus]